MAQPRDFYEVLGVARNADADTIKKAYRKLAMQFHPDKNPGNKEAEDKFKEAAAAYEVLSNAEKKSKYDRFGHAAFGQSMGGGPGGFQGMDINDIFASFGDVFGDIFGEMGGQRGRGGRNRPTRGADLRYVMEVDLKDAVDGLEKEIKFETEEACEKCTGTGSDPAHPPKTCGTCRGSGQIVRAQGFFSMASTCPTCRGQGKLVTHPCKPCKGQGRLESKRQIKVKVPPGVDTGTRLRLTGEGEGGFNGGPAGDLYVEVRVRDDKRFLRRENDLIGKVEVSYLQAILGASVEVETLKGREFIDIPAGTQPGAMIRMGGKGVPSLRGYARGDMYFEVNVKIPTKLSKREEESLREMAEATGENVQKKAKGLFGSSKKERPETEQ
jgi:molecular chaperone DnaJ